MPVQLIIQLLVTFGPEAIDGITKLIALFESNGAVTSAQWATLSTSLTQTAQDRTRAQLVAAGIALDSPQAVAMLALAK